MKWILVGDGEVKSTLRQLIHRHALGDFVKMLSLQPEEEMPLMFASVNLLLLNQVGAVKNDSRPLEAPHVHGSRKTDSRRGEPGEPGCPFAAARDGGNDRQRGRPTGARGGRP